MYNISFICGREAIEHFGVFEPEYGMVIYLILQNEIGDGLWIPDFNNIYRSHMVIVNEGLEYKDMIKLILDRLDHNNIDFSDIKTIKLEGLPVKD